MTAARGSAEWSRLVAAARVEQQRLTAVDGVLSDMLIAAMGSQIRKDFRDCSAELAKLDHFRAVKDSVRPELDMAEDRVDELLMGPEYVEQHRRSRAEIRARGRVERGIERSR
ncbi:hypothetical protein [Nocardia carnea]|uniref:hypothetical protein n=1 Tax=Nocardia carnea TaxID=37328 RepID=UPI002455EF5C|nr:hypothetical protein [Nocardia carnea]